jgi:hypothetical protein
VEKMAQKSLKNALTFLFGTQIGKAYPVFSLIYDGHYAKKITQFPFSVQKLLSI